MNGQSEIIAQRLREALTPRSMIVGVGNRLRGDDGAGPALVDALGDSVATLDCGVAPENYLEKIVAAEPDTVLFVDVLEAGGEAGKMRLVEPKDIGDAGLSTHALSLQMASEYLQARFPVRVLLLGIQPEALELDSGLSEAVAAAVACAASLIVEAVNHA